jgi:predicted DNA binding CopG/RHH family protein
MDQDKIDQLRDYYDNTDVAEHFTGATFQTDKASKILVSTSIRLPQSLMNKVRAQAAELGIPTTALIRQWVTERATSPSTQAVIPVADLQRFIAERAHPIAP